MRGRRSIKDLIADALKLSNPGRGVSTSITGEIGDTATLRVDTGDSGKLYESTTKVVTKPLARERWLAKIP